MNGAMLDYGQFRLGQHFLQTPGIHGSGYCLQGFIPS
jgi:hypothetical protein